MKKMQLKFGGILVAFMCVLLSGFVNAAQIMDLDDDDLTTYETLTEALSKKTGGTLRVMGDIDGEVCQVEHDITLQIEDHKLGKDANLMMITVSNCTLTVECSGGSQNMIGQFKVVDGGHLKLKGGTYQNTEKVIVVDGDISKTNVVELTGGAKITPTTKDSGIALCAVQMDAPCVFHMNQSSMITSTTFQSLTTSYTYAFQTGIVVSADCFADIGVASGTINAEYVAIADDSKMSDTIVTVDSSIVKGGIIALRLTKGKCNVVNDSSVEGVIGIRIADAHVTIADSRVTSRQHAIQNKKENDYKLEVSGNSVITGSAKSFNEADITNNHITITGGTFSNNPTNDFGACVDKWVDGTKYTVTWPDENMFVVGAKIEITYNFNAEGVEPEFTNVYYSSASGSVDVSAETPDKFGVKPEGKMFDGWYYSKADASNGVNKVLTVNCSTNLYARWLDKFSITYVFGEDCTPSQTNVVFGTTNDTFDVSLVTPESLGVTNDCAIFECWLDDSGSVVTNVTNGETVYAKWLSCLVTFCPGITNAEGEVEFISATNECVNVKEWVDANRQVDLQAAGIDADWFGWSQEEMKFSGWSYEKSGFHLVTKISIAETNKPLYAIWTDFDDVAYVIGELFKTLEDAIKYAEKGTNTVVVLADITEDVDCSEHSAVIDLHGKSIGTAEKPITVTVGGGEGGGQSLTMFGSGYLYGKITVNDDGKVYLADVTCTSSDEDGVVCADGTNYEFVAERSAFKGAVNALQVFDLQSADGTGFTLLSNVVVECVESAATVECGIFMVGGELYLDDTKVRALQNGIWMVNGEDGSCTNICRVTNGSSISAYRGINAEPADILISDSSIVSSVVGGMNKPYSLYLTGAGGVSPRIMLSGTNSFVGGEVVYGKSVNGGFMWHDGAWNSALTNFITGGTYSHQGVNQDDQAVVSNAWVDVDRCILEWLDGTTFKVTDRAFTFKMQYEDWPDVVTNLYDLSWTTNEVSGGVTNEVRYVTITNIHPRDLWGYEPTNCTFAGWAYDSAGTMKVVDPVKYGEPVTFYATWMSTSGWTIEYKTDITGWKMATSNNNPTAYNEDSIFEFQGIAYTSNNVDFVTNKWYFEDSSLGKYPVMAISGGMVMIRRGNAATNEYSGVSCTNIVLKASISSGGGGGGGDTITFGTGVLNSEVDPEFDPEFDEPMEVEWKTFDGEEPGGWPVGSDDVCNGIEYDETMTTISLPTADEVKREGHTFYGWIAYKPLYDEDGNIIGTNYYPSGSGSREDAQIFTDSIPIEDVEKIKADGYEDDWPYTLHAVWDVGSGQKGISSFDELYNGDLPPLTGGDTYVGVITDDDGSVIGTISVKCGMPQGDGSVNIVATVKMLNGDSRTFMGKGAYLGETIAVDLTSGEHTLSLTLNSKMIEDGNYDGYAIAGGINKFKGSETDKEEGDARLEHWLGKWTFIFATEDATSAYNTQKTEEGEFVEKDGLEYDYSFGDMHAYGYSYVQIDIGNKGKVKIEGKLANGKDISTTATAIVGDNGVCVPVMCSVYSGWERLFTGGRRGGFGFTAWFSNFETNAYGVVESNDGDVITINGVSEWDSSMSKSTPFTATLVPTNCQRVADIELEDGQKFVFDIDLDTPGWKDHEKLAEICGDWLPLSPYNPYLYWYKGYIQYVTVGGIASQDTNETEQVGYNLSVPNKAPKMKLVDSDPFGLYVVPNKGGTNYSALKIKYNNDKGVFKGSFRVYSVRTNDETGKSALKTTKISFKGAIADGQGYGVGRNSKYGSHPIMLSNPTNLVTEVVGGDDGDEDDDDDESEEIDEESVEE